MTVKPLTLSEANSFVASFHRHNGKVVSHRFSIGLENGGELIGVAIVGRPIARQVNFTETAEVTRLCVRDTAPKGACSKLYRACWRAWLAMGGKRLITYTLKSESGASLRGAGFKLLGDVGLVSKPWGSKNREREWQPIYGQQKLRWEIT